MIYFIQQPVAGLVQLVQYNQSIQYWA